ncbi:MAG: glycosyltransferase family 4 protein [Chitinophagales bacterium]|nr:glycosyltransferase family 4 protein [Chitinophagales bacterium]
MEIIHLILGKANPNRMNGVNKVVNSLATHQSDLGFDVSVWGITPSLEENYPSRNYRTELFPSKRNKLRISKKVTDRIMELDENAVVHLHGGFIPEFYHVSRALKKAGVRYVLTPHGAYNRIAMQRSKWRKKIYFSMFERSVASNAHALHCIGQSEIDELGKLLEKNNGVLIPNGQNVEDLRSDLGNRKNKQNPVFGFIGRIDIHTKGLDNLLNGFAHFIHQHGGKGKLWIIGDGTELQILKDLAVSLNIEKDVRFWGKRFGEEKLKLMSEMDAFFHPSRNEGLPGAVLEAAGMKIPCVVSKESNMADYVNSHNAGIGLGINDAHNIAGSMQDLEVQFRNGKISDLGENAFHMVKTEFDWNSIADQLINVYKGK